MDKQCIMTEQLINEKSWHGRRQPWRQLPQCVSVSIVSKSRLRRVWTDKQMYYSVSLYIYLIWIIGRLSRTPKKSNCRFWKCSFVVVGTRHGAWSSHFITKEQNTDWMSRNCRACWLRFTVFEKKRSDSRANLHKETWSVVSFPKRRTPL